MKFNTIKLILLVLVLMQVSCDNALDLEPEDRQDLTINSISDTEGLLLGVYFQVFRDFQQRAMTGLPQSANQFFRLTAPENNVFNFRPAMRADNDGGADRYWEVGYNAIARANFLIDNIDLVDENSFPEGSTPGISRKEEIIGEARFLRGHVYYYLTKLFGDVPLITQFPESSDPGANDVARTPVEEVRAFYTSDFESAAASLPWRYTNLLDENNSNENGETINSKGRVTKGAAKLMLAKLAAEDQEWENVIGLVNEIENSGEFTLVDDFFSIFGTFFQNTDESIWEIQTFNPGFNNQGGYLFLVPDVRINSVPPEKYFLYEGDEDDPKDLRQGVTARRAPLFGEVYYRGVKFIPFDVDGSRIFDDPTNFVLLRLADALLLKAEALNETSYPNQEALDIINQLRGRTAGTYNNITYPGVDPVSFDTLSTQDSFREFLRDERERELMLEPHQFFDLLRYDSYDGGNRALLATSLDPSSPGGGGNPGKLLLPIPIRDLEINPLLTQNPGY
ncbi:RagB/SusD family nutrient uptake outer membrane protein [Maribacter sp. 2307ULW6-5]|uniref:RagB/SusD family nutrient uptake outer membrane protein n=1 Tax=Maribacter sp. 2307ULW6-5 TaxID=3386275 RepID=UPI0039BD38A5